MKKNSNHQNPHSRDIKCFFFFFKQFVRSSILSSKNWLHVNIDEIFCGSRSFGTFMVSVSRTQRMRLHAFGFNDHLERNEAISFEWQRFTLNLHRSGRCTRPFQNPTSVGPLICTREREGVKNLNFTKIQKKISEINCIDFCRVSRCERKKRISKWKPNLLILFDYSKHETV